MSWKHAAAPERDMREAQQAHRSAIKNLGPLPSLPSKAGLLTIFETMVRIRTFEEQAWKSALDGEGLPIHPSTGHEAIAAGVCSALRRGDRALRASRLRQDINRATTDDSAGRHKTLAGLLCNARQVHRLSL